MNLPNLFQCFTDYRHSRSFILLVSLMMLRALALTIFWSSLAIEKSFSTRTSLHIVAGFMALFYLSLLPAETCCCIFSTFINALGQKLNDYRDFICRQDFQGQLSESDDLIDV